MGLTADEIAGHPALHDCIRRQAQALVLAFEANPRLASVFATQQRWLLAHVGACPLLPARPARSRQRPAHRALPRSGPRARGGEPQHGGCFHQGDAQLQFRAVHPCRQRQAHPPAGADERPPSMRCPAGPWCTCRRSTASTADSRLDSLPGGPGFARQAAAADCRRPAHIERGARTGRGRSRCSPGSTMAASSWTG